MEVFIIMFVPSVQIVDARFYLVSFAAFAHSRQITLSNFTKSGDTLLCKTHYFKRFKEEGNYLGGEKFDQKSSRGNATTFAPTAPQPSPTAPPPASAAPPASVAPSSSAPAPSSTEGM
jgi:hypothetical protein